jgi:hypothetical protein
MTPSIKNWWAARSIASLRERIDRLENQLAEYKQCTELSEEGDLIMIAIELVIILLLICLLMVDGVLLIVTYPIPVRHSTLFWLVAVVAYVGFADLVVFLKPERVRRSPSTRRRIRRSVTELKEKLANRTGTP